MGLDYTNVVLKGAERERVVSYFRRGGRDGYIAPTVDGVTVVYDRACEDMDEQILTSLGADLSRVLGVPALVSLVHDSDVFRYYLFAEGREVDRYDAVPGYSDPHAPADLPASGGNAEVLCAAFGVPDAADVVAVLLHQNDEEEVLYGEDLHAELAAALELPAFAAETGYYVVENGVLPADLHRSALVRTL